MEITLKDIQNNLQTLPKELFQNVNDYISSLKFQNSAKKENLLKEDWADSLTSDQKKSVERGIDDIKNGRTLSQKKKKKKIREYIKEATK
mgnify:CR=1 FL=1